MFSLTQSYDPLSTNLADLKEKALFWADQFNLVSYYDHNEVPYKYQGFENILAVSNTLNLQKPEDAFTYLKSILEIPTSNIWCGYFGYDLKNQIEKLESRHPDQVGFPLFYFFQPETYLVFTPTEIQVYSQENNCQQILREILDFSAQYKGNLNSITMEPRVAKEAYLKHVKAIQQEILEGEIYEMNYCLEFYAEQVQLDPLSIFQHLNRISPMPFAGYFKLTDKYLLCASPERFLKKEKLKLISQPIKGTIRRGNNPDEDKKLKEKLRTDEKEIAENMMIMDLVRNDLSKSCLIGSVKVEEMFGIYGFSQVFQMITTVTGELRTNCSAVDAIRNAFPMGSMTGAPKIRAMELIEKYESTRRGLYSGAFGYFKPNGDFDFNVVIRSLQYNASRQYLSFMVGSAITFDSDPEKEYQECLLKGQAMMQILETSGA